MRIDVPSAHGEKTKINKNSATKVDTNGNKLNPNGNKLDTRFRSLKETVLDVGLGLIIATILNYTILPLFVTGIENREILTMAQISVIYTVFALIRRYGMRRLFEIRRG